MKLATILVLAALAVTTAKGGNPNSLRATDFEPVDVSKTENVDQLELDSLDATDNGSVESRPLNGVNNEDSADLSTKSTVSSKSSKKGGEPFSLGPVYNDDLDNTLRTQDDVTKGGMLDPSMEPTVASKSSKTGGEPYSVGNVYDDDLDNALRTQDDVTKDGMLDPSIEPTVASKSSKKGGEPYSVGNVYDDDFFGTTGDQDNDMDNDMTHSLRKETSQQNRRGWEQKDADYIDESSITDENIDAIMDKYAIAKASTYSSGSGYDIEGKNGMSPDDLMSNLKDFESMINGGPHPLTASPAKSIVASKSSKTGGEPYSVGNVYDDDLDNTLRTQDDVTKDGMLDSPIEPLVASKSSKTAGEPYLVDNVYDDDSVGTTGNEMSTEEMLLSLKDLDSILKKNSEPFKQVSSNQDDGTESYGKTVENSRLDPIEGQNGETDDPSMVNGATKSNYFTTEDDNEFETKQGTPEQIDQPADEDHPLQFN
ncbi:uncharacterized protein CCR75_005753 [Bremia lactucae]|uniref:Uncharacterized protein n=1 Tax=Bremia lactucae TaxID=4779 RepID=A0A976FGC7_BRELC|nr:hypothetical protein CCR75_005753 [Bremia lactucae]